MYSINLTMQGKGGVGKSFSAALLAQYLLSKGYSVTCADTDPVNSTFTQYKSLDVAHIDITENKVVATSKFEPLMIKMMELDSNFVIDNGASSFLPLVSYMEENKILEIMAEAGKKIFIHSSVVGGVRDTYNGFAHMAEQVKDHAKIVVWENEHFGPVEFDGIALADTKAFKSALKEGKIAGVVKLKDRRHSDTYTKDVKRIIDGHFTLADVMADDNFNFLAKNRIEIVVNDVFAELDKVTW